MIAEWDIWKFRGDDMKLFRNHGDEQPVKRGPGRPRKVQP